MPVEYLACPTRQECVFAHERKMGIAVGFLSSLGLNSCGNPASSDIHASMMIHPLLVEKQLLVFALKSQCLVILILLWSERTFCLVLPQKTGSCFLMGTNCLSAPPSTLPRPFYFWEICVWLKLFIWKAAWLLLMKSILDELFLIFFHWKCFLVGTQL